MPHARLVGFILIAILLGTVLPGCSPPSSEEAVNVHRDRARGLVEKQQFHEALTAYQHIVKLDPQDHEAYYQLALLHLRVGKPEDIDLAHQALLKVVKLKGSRIDAHVQLAYLYLGSKQPAKARLHADAILAAEPTNTDGHFIQGMSLVQEGRLERGIAELRKAIESDPKRHGTYLELARIYAQQYSFSEAAAVLRDSLYLDPQSVETRTALGDVLAAGGKEAEAAKEYLRGLEIDRNRGLLYFKLAELSQKQQRFGEAEGFYREWIEVLPNDAQAHLALGQFYRSTGRMKEAVTSYQRARQVDPSSHLAHEALIIFYLETNRLKEAGLEIDALLKQNPTDTAGRILQARLMLEQGDTEKALPQLLELARHAPKSATVHQYLGIARARRHELPEAISALKEARTLAPNSSEIRTNLAQAYLAQGSLSQAIREGETAIEFNPKNVSALRTLADALLLAGDMKRAQELLREVVAVLPDDPIVHHRLGVVARKQHRTTEAMAHFEQAFKKNPELLEALEQIVAILVSQGKVPQASERVGRQIAMNPQDPRLLNLLGGVLVQSLNFSEAEAAFKKAMALDGTLLSTYANLGELYTRQGKVEEAIREFEMIVAKSPQQLSALMILGILHEQRKDYARATIKYEEALRVNPKFAPAANNLAWILIEYGGDKERAMSYAETAWQAFPRDPYIGDTLGWVYYHKQMYARSVSLLKESIDQLPEHPLILYHYGMAQYANNNSVEAKKSLAKFLTLSPDNPHAHKAKEALAALS
jgi:tetratricopeptide (TPR) repeat protein